VALPNFLLIGAGKSGTTSLYYYLKQHPEVYMSPIKGPNFFAFEGREPPSRNTVTDTFPSSGAYEIDPARLLFRTVSWRSLTGESKEVSESSSFGDASTPERGL
jgi:hypothetical protein